MEWWVWLLLIVVVVVVLLAAWWWWTRMRGSSMGSAPAAPRTEPRMESQSAPMAAEPAPMAAEPAPMAAEPAPMAAEPAPTAPAAMPSAAADKLELIEGIGPKIAGVLRAAGISTFAQLAGADVDRLEQILRDADLPLAKPGSWPAQARLAADGRFAELQQMQDSLKGGR